jgi:hypothetical protein
MEFFSISMDKLDIPGVTEIYRVKTQLSMIFFDDILIDQYVGHFVILVRTVTKPLLYYSFGISNSNSKPVIYQ